MSLGIFFWYMSVYMQTIRGDSLLKVGIQYLPLIITGCASSFLATWFVTKEPAQAIIRLGCASILIMIIFLATMPPKLTYWAMVFPAVLLSAFAMSGIITSTQISVINAVTKNHRGVAGSFIVSVLIYGMVTGVGLAGSMEVQHNDHGKNLLRGYRFAAYLGTGFAIVALGLSCLTHISNRNESRLEQDQEELPRVD